MQNARVLAPRGRKTGVKSAPYRRRRPAGPENDVGDLAGGMVDGRGGGCERVAANRERIIGLETEERKQGNSAASLRTKWSIKEKEKTRWKIISTIQVTGPWREVVWLKVRLNQGLIIFNNPRFFLLQEIRGRRKERRSQGIPRLLLRRKARWSLGLVVASFPFYCTSRTHAGDFLPNVEQGHSLRILFASSLACNLCRFGLLPIAPQRRQDMCCLLRWPLFRVSVRRQNRTGPAQKPWKGR
jgi:hypothetical protein